jgi:two-component system, OmpR family, response regulator
LAWRDSPDGSTFPESYLSGIAMPDKRILLVEDEPDIRQLLSHTLRSAGYVVDVAATAAEAWAHLNAQAYASVIADWRLPDGDGVAIADWAAEQGSRTFVMSGYLFQMPGGRAERHQTLMKPLRPSEIVAAVEHGIGKAEAS